MKADDYQPSPEQQALIEAAMAAPCDMYHEPPMDFAYCETHDETFPLGRVCRFYKKVAA